MNEKILSHQKNQLSLAVNRENILIFFLSILLILQTFYLYYFQPVEYVKLIQEDLLGEWVTFLSFFFACFFFGFLFFKSTPKIKGIWFLLIAIASIFIAMDEISWGQRLFRINLPQYFADKNFQGEMNFHNIQGFMADQWTIMKIVGIIFIFYGLFLPVVTHLSTGIDNLRKKIFIPVPPLSLSPLFVIVFVFFVFHPLIKVDEIGEMYMGITICLFGFYHWLSYFQDNRSQVFSGFVNKVVVFCIFSTGILAIIVGKLFSPTIIYKDLNSSELVIERTTKLIQGYQQFTILGGILFIVCAIILFYKSFASQKQKDWVLTSFERIVHRKELCMILFLPDSYQYRQKQHQDYNVPRPNPAWL